MIPDDLPESLTLDQLRKVWGEAEADDWDAVYDEDDRVNEERKVCTLDDFGNAIRAAWNRRTGGLT